MKRFKHSGTLGDIVYAMGLVKHFGGGEFYLHLNQIDWVVKHYYGGTPDPFHRGRMTQQDYEFMQSFMEAQDYITEFKVLDPQATEITHNLDRFRPAFVGHPGNYVDIYCQAFGIHDPETRSLIRNTAWLTVPQPRDLGDRPIVINRTARWVSKNLNPAWADLREQGAEARGRFVGLESEYEAFVKHTGWRDLEYTPTDNMLELAEVIAGADQFIGNQSVALSLAIGLGVNYACEARQDLPLERNECWFPQHPNGDYF
jgi:hypothetical protein